MKLLLKDFLLILCLALLLTSCRGASPDVSGIVVAKEHSSFLVFEEVSYNEISHLLNDPDEAIKSGNYKSAIWIHDNTGIFSSEVEVGDEVEVWLDLKESGIDTSNPASTDAPIIDLKIIEENG